MMRLGQNALKIYLLVTSNANGYHFLMTSNNVTEELGFSRSTYTRAIKELIDEGFLIKRTDGSEVWDFYDNPPVKEQMHVNVVKTIS